MIRDILPPPKSKKQHALHTSTVQLEKALTRTYPEAHKDEPRWLVFGLRFLAYAIPLGFLLYVLYWNFLPFGYDETFTINVGSPGDTNASNEFYLEPSKYLSEPKTEANGTTTYRELNGIAYAIFRPKAVLTNATITVSVEGDGVGIIPPHIDFDPNSVQWDYAWDFTKGIPSDLTGNAFYWKDSTSTPGCAYFDGNSRLEFASSSDMFENGPFTVYAEWTPENNKGDNQEIVGHYNWEILQNLESVQFQVGRMDGIDNNFYFVTYPIVNQDFFVEKHTLIATYIPETSNSRLGYIDLTIDNSFVGRTYFGKSHIRNNFGNSNLTFGINNFSSGSYFRGCLYRVAILNSNNNIYNDNAGNILKIKAENSESLFHIFSSSSSTLRYIVLNIRE